MNTETNPVTSPRISPLGILIAASSLVLIGLFQWNAAGAAYPGSGDGNFSNSSRPFGRPGGHDGMHGRGPGGFALGICVGQTLALGGVTLPAPTLGQPPAFDDATKTALKTAIETCRAQFKAAQPPSDGDPIPDPSPSPSPGLDEGT